MKLQQSHIENKDVTFESDDLFHRKEIWNSLTNLIENSENESLVISVNAQWWEWKTHFLNCWKNDLEKLSKNVIYFDAFENDFIEDPFLPLLWEILNNLPDSENVKSKAENVMKWILPLAWKVWMRFLTGWDIESVDDNLEKLFEWDIANYTWKLLEEYTKKDNSIKLFKESLEKIIKSEWEIVFIIDELDRCRPDFALKLLERIKHFFNIEGLYFVLWMNKIQVEAYVQKIYWKIDTNNYLQKFIDIEINLTKNISMNDSDYSKFINMLINENYRDIFDKIPQIKDSSIFILTFLSQLNNLSFREVEKALNYYILFLKSIRHVDYVINPFIILSCIIKVKENYLYTKMKEWINIKVELVEKLQLSTLIGYEWIYSKQIKIILDTINYYFDEEINEDIHKIFHQSFWYDEGLSDRQNNILIFIKILDLFKI